MISADLQPKPPNVVLLWRKDGENQSYMGKPTNRPLPCKFYQKGSNSHIADSNGRFYLYLCTNCFAQGKSNAHPSKDCRRSAPKND